MIDPLVLQFSYYFKDYETTYYGYLRNNQDGIFKYCLVTELSVTLESVESKTNFR